MASKPSSREDPRARSVAPTPLLPCQDHEGGHALDRIERRHVARGDGRERQARLPARAIERLDRRAVRRKTAVPAGPAPDDSSRDAGLDAFAEQRVDVRTAVGESSSSV